MRAVVRAALVIGVVVLSGQAGALALPSPPGPGALAVRSDRDGAYGYYAVDAGGRRMKRLLPGEADALAWSPDGKRIAFTREGDAVFVVRADGRGLRRLATGAAVYGGLAWSPDGTRIAVETAAGLAVLDVRTGRRRQLTTARADEPRWSPDGETIAYTLDDRLWLIRSDGSARRKLVARCCAGDATWSPDGRRLAFELNDRRGNTELAVVDADGKGRRRIVPPGVGLVLEPRWSPRGDLIAFTGSKGVYVVRPDGTGRRRIGTLAAIGAAAWSADARLLAVTAGVPQFRPPLDVWVIRVADGRERRVTRGRAYGYSSVAVEWHPRGLPLERVPGPLVSPEVPSDSVREGNVLKTSRVVSRLAADGSRVAVAYAAAGSAGNCVETWDPLADSLVRFYSDCEALDIALAGERLAWIDYHPIGAGTDSFGLLTATPAARAPVQASGICDTPSIRPHPCNLPLLDLEGEGSLLAFDSSDKACRYYRDCPTAPRRNGTLWRLDGAQAVEIGSSEEELTVLAVDDGRILVDEGGAALVVRDASGTALRTFSFPDGFRGGALEGSDLVVQTASAVEHYDVDTGALLHAWPVAADARLENVQSGTAAYVAGTEVHLLRLADGAENTIEAAAGPVHARIEAPGLFYSSTASDTEYPGRLTFVPLSELGLLVSVPAALRLRVRG